MFTNIHTGRFITKFRTKGLITGGNYLADPMGIAVMDNGNVLVADSEKACVQMFDESGKYLGKFGQDDASRLRHPAGNTVKLVVFSPAYIKGVSGRHCIILSGSSVHIKDFDSTPITHQRQISSA